MSLVRFQIKFVVHPVTGIKVPYCPHGPIPHVQPPIPSSKWKPLHGIQRPYDGLPWWRDKKYVVGLLSTNPRPIRIINTSVPQSHRHTLTWVSSRRNKDSRFSFKNYFATGGMSFKSRIGLHCSVNKWNRETERRPKNFGAIFWCNIFSINRCDFLRKYLMKAEKTTKNSSRWRFNGI